MAAGRLPLHAPQFPLRHLQVLPNSPRTIETVLPVSVRTAIGSSASARLGMPMSSRTENSISVPCGALTHFHEPSKEAMSPSS